MKKYLIPLFLILFAPATFSQSIVESPCNDSLYVSLKTKAIGQMTDREFAYFNQKEKDCAEYRKAMMQEEVKIETLQITKKTMNTYWTLGIIAVAVSFIPLLLIKR
jgi:hypothetical protein